MPRGWDATHHCPYDAVHRQFQDVALGRDLLRRGHAPSPREVPPPRSTLEELAGEIAPDGVDVVRVVLRTVVLDEERRRLERLSMGDYFAISLIRTRTFPSGSRKSASQRSNVSVE